MKKVLIAGCVCLAIGGFAAENAMTAGDFSNGLKNWRYLKSGKDMLHSVENGILKVTGNEANWGKPSFVSAIYRLGPMTPGKKYQLEATVSSQVSDVKGKELNIVIRAVKGENSSISYNGIWRVDLSNPAKRIYNAVYVVPANAVRCEIYIQSKLNTGDVVSIDDIKITPYELTAASDGNLVKNGDFSGVLLDSWTGFFKEVREKYVYIVPDGDSNGNRCLAVTGDKSKFTTTFIQGLPKMDPAKSYIITAKINAGLADTKGKKLEITVRSADGAKKTLNYKGFSVALGHKGWREYRAEIKVHPQTVSNQFYISALGFVPGDIVLIDDIKLTPAE